LLRELYVNVAEYDFALSDKEQTDSRVSLLTGIHRKEVRRLREAGAPISAAPAAVSRASRIIARWRSAPEFIDGQKKPLPLPRISDQRANPSFESLVASVTRDVRARSVLDEWLNRKIVRIDAEGRVVLTEAAYAPQTGDEQQLSDLGRNLHDHIAAAAANVVGEDPRFTERAVRHEGLSKALAQTLEERSRELTDGLLRDVNREAEAARAADPGGDYRWTFGVYIYHEKDRERQPKTGSEKSAPQKDRAQNSDP
jgi:hypothetical protein